MVRTRRGRGPASPKASPACKPRRNGRDGSGEHEWPPTAQLSPNRLRPTSLKDEGVAEQARLVGACREEVDQPLCGRQRWARWHVWGRTACGAIPSRRRQAVRPRRDWLRRCRRERSQPIPLLPAAGERRALTAQHGRSCHVARQPAPTPLGGRCDGSACAHCSL